MKIKKLDRETLSPRKEYFWGILWIGAWVTSLLFCYSSPVARSIQNGEPVVGLLFGSDQAKDSEHSDTILLASFDPRRSTMEFISIPRDTRVNIPGYKFRRINEVYGYYLRTTGDVGKASEGVVHALEVVLSTAAVQVRIPFYVHIDFDGFRKIIDEVGGVWVDVPEPMDYDDHAGGYHFHAKPGRHHFMGDQALTYVRFRGQSGDKGRILRQHAFIRTVFKTVLSPYETFRFPLLLATAWRSVNTNMGFGDMACLALGMRTLRPERIGFKLLPGSTSGPYWAMDREATNFVAEQFMGMVPHDSRMTETIRPLKNRITVNVWNASGEPGMARRIALVLRKANFDVVEWGNSDMRQHATRVIDRSGNLDAARKVAQFLETEDLHSELNPGLLVDVEVILGEDYHGPGSAPGHSWGSL